MKPFLKILSFAGLATMAAASLLLFNGVIDQHAYRVVALIGTGLWFATVPFWMKRRLHQSE